MENKSFEEEIKAQKWFTCALVFKVQQEALFIYEEGHNGYKEEPRDQI